MMFRQLLCISGLLFLGASVGAFAPSQLRMLTPLVNQPTQSTAWPKKQGLKTPAFQRMRQDSTVLQASPLGIVMGGVKALHGDSRFVLAAIMWLSAFGVSLERDTVFGKALSAPLVTMLLSLVIANLGLLPFASPVCKFYFHL
jgi:hypothetical protein